MTEKLTKVPLTNLEKMIYPDLEISKRQFIEYYIKIAPRILEFLTNRPLVLTRYPNGINKEGFYAKDAPEGKPAWVKTIKQYSPSVQRYINYIICNDLDTLIWLANMVAVEIHIPLFRVEDREKPDFVFFDLDPEPPATFQDAVKVALLLNEKLVALGLCSYLKTSGKKGLHVIIPIRREYTFGQTREFVHIIGQHLAKESEIVVSEFSDTKKPGKVFVDYGQNSHGKTLVSPYSLRATPYASVSTPIFWKDLEKNIKPEEFNITNVPGLKSEPWKDIFSNMQKLEI
jgi:bifunctional non-homologous end joining protein LigD